MNNVKQNSTQVYHTTELLSSTALKFIFDEKINKNK